MPEALREAASYCAPHDPAGTAAGRFSAPLQFVDMRLLEPAVAFLHEHAIQRAHTARRYGPIPRFSMTGLIRWSRAAIPWNEVDASDLIAYRDRMLKQPSAHTGRALQPRTINHRVRGVLRLLCLGCS